LQLFFTSNSVGFVDKGRKNISCPRAQGNLATPLCFTLLQVGLLLGNVQISYDGFFEQF